MEPERSLVDLVYEAVFDESAWQSFLAKLDVFLGIEGSHLVLGLDLPADPSRVFGRLHVGGKPAPDVEARYLREFVTLDERLPRLPELPAGRPILSRSLFTAEEIRGTSVVYNEFLRPLGGTNQVVVRVTPEARHDFWVLTRYSPNEFDGRDIELIERLGAHVGRMIRVRRALSRVDALRSTLGAALDQAAAALFLLDAAGQIVECNARARELLHADTGFVVRDGALGGRSSGDHHALRGAVSSALPGSDPPRATSVRIPSTDPDRPFLVDVSPVRESQWPWVGSPLVLVLVRDPWSVPHLKPEVIQRFLGLTVSEAEVAVLLVAGLSVRRIAELRGRSVESVRWHLKQIYEKTGLRRQAELVRVVLALAGTKA